MRDLKTESTQLSKKGLVRFFENIWKNQRPLFKTFESNPGKYLYDTGTGKILCCDNIQHTFLSHLNSDNLYNSINNLIGNMGYEEALTSLNELADTIKSENILQAFSKDFAFISKHFIDLDKQMDTEMGHIVLEVTESCNLRCSYCIHGRFFKKARNHSNRHMSIDTAKKAIDYLVAHSSLTKDIGITFYGGEPLLRLDFIKSCIDYAKSKAGSKPVTFSMTTNAVLLTEEVAAFLFSENIGMNISIDGPEDIHNSCRIDAKGAATFSRAIKGLEILVKRYGSKAKELISLSMVYTPPFYKDKLNQIANLWDIYPWMKGIIPSITYTQAGSMDISDFSEEELFEEQTIDQWMKEIFQNDYKNKKQSHVMIREILIQTLIRIVRKPQYDEPLSKASLNGCCLPGVRKIYIKSDGEMRLCERINDDAPSIGHIDKGIRKNLIKDTYVKKYSEASIENCRKCWANKLCRLCYTDAFSNNDIDMDMKNRSCASLLKAIENDLSFYSRLLEIDPAGMQFMNNITFN